MYSAEISRKNPTCFLFLIDQSSSMLEPFGEQTDINKADGVADAINRLLQNLAIKCSKAEGVRDYFYVGVFSYGGPVKPALGGRLEGKSLVPISEIANNPIRIEEKKRKVSDGAGGLVDQPVKFPVWFEATAVGRTPMCQVLSLAQKTVREFIKRFPKCYPPLVMNITDGMATDGDPQQPAKDLQNVTSEDGGVLLFNAHISAKKATPVEFPDEESVLPDRYARLLFHMSSVLPPTLQDAARFEGLTVSPKTRGFVFNADLVSTIRFLDIGTKATQALTGRA